MAEKNLNTRIINKHDIEENWLKAVNFIPIKGELIVYDIDADHAYERIKMGDGETNVSDLPFIGDFDPITNDEIDAICGTTLYTEYDEVL